jgi:hypothetical protein
MTERTRTDRLSRTLVLLLAILVVAARIAAAQGSAEGTISGTVTDQTRAVLPGVAIAATNPATGFVREATTDAAGNFIVAALPPGTYTVVAMLSGFSTFQRTITLTVGSEVKLPISLAVGSLNETLTVTGDAPLVEITRTEQGATLGENEVRNLPINSRDFTDFALLAPGVVASRTGGAGPGAGGGGFSTSGQRGEQNAMNIDGMANKSYDNNSEAGNFSQEAVQEFQVLTQSYPAEFGHATGGVINAVTKSGTNQFSGYGFFFLRHNAFDKPPFDLATEPNGVVKAVPAKEANEFQRRIVGFTIGGPIKQNKAFFFGVFDRTDSNTPQVRTILDSTLDVVRQLAIPDLADNASNKVTQSRPRSTKTSVKVDMNFSARHNGSARFSSATNFSPAGTANGRNSVEIGSESNGTFYLASGSLNSFFSQRTLNTVRFNFNRDSSTNEYPHRGGYANADRMNPGIVIGGSSGGTFGGGSAGTLSPRLIETKYELQDTLSLYRGAHDLKMGAYFQAVPFLQDFLQYGLGSWQFSDLNAFRAGVPSLFRQAFGPQATYMVTRMYAGFAQDAWRPMSKLTIDYGVRYEINTRPDMTRFDLPEPGLDPASGKFTVGSNGSPYTGKYKTDTNNVMPRVGASYTPDNGKTVIRGGGGMFYGVQQMSAVSQGAMWTGENYGQFVFSSGDALPLWQGMHDPRSPWYNNGLLRLSQPVMNTLRAQGKPVGQQRYHNDIREPRSYQASAGVERALASWLSGQATFLWSRGYDNVRNANVNLRGPMAFAAGALLPSGTVTPYDITYAGGPRPDPSRDEFSSYEDIGRISYRGLSGVLTARWSGLQLRATYTRNLTWDDSVSTNSRIQPGFQPDPTCARFGAACEWAESVLSTHHRFGISSVYMLPQSWPIYARNWQVSGIFNVESGHPFAVQSGFDFNNDVVLTDRPLGVPRTALWTDGYSNLDLRIARFIPLHARQKLEVIFEAFNALNQPHYSNYVDSLYVFQGGRYVPRPDFVAFHNSPLLNQRDLDRTAKDIGLDTKSRRNAVSDPFQGQLALRFHF